MSLLLIDDRGDVWDGQSRKLREAFDSPYSGGEFSDYAVANLGFVALNIYGSSCQIRLRPAVLGEAALRALRTWLSQSRHERVVLTWLGDNWSNELLRAGPESLLRLEQLVASGHGAKPHDFLARRLGSSDLPGGSPLRDLLDAWPTLARPQGERDLLHLIELVLGQRYLVVKQPAECGKLVFHSFGNELFSDYDTWRACAVGAPMEEMPDRSYGRLVAPAYYETLRERKPRVEDVDAIIHWPRAGRSRLRYKRLIVPLLSDRNSPLLLGGSVLDNSIDLRLG